MTATQRRLEHALAIRSEWIFNAAKRGLKGDELSELKELASIWRIMSTAGPSIDPLDQRPGEDDAVYQARLEAMKK
jgi:hypothetical protein